MIETSNAIIQNTAAYQLSLLRNPFAVSVVKNMDCEFVAYYYMVCGFVILITLLLINP